MLRLNLKIWVKCRKRVTRGGGGNCITYFTNDPLDYLHIHKNTRIDLLPFEQPLPTIRKKLLEKYQRDISMDGCVNEGLCVSSGEGNDPVG